MSSIMPRISSDALRTNFPDISLNVKKGIDNAIPQPLGTKKSQEIPMGLTSIKDKMQNVTQKASNFSAALASQVSGPKAPVINISSNSSIDRPNLQNYSMFPSATSMPAGRTMGEPDTVQTPKLPPRIFEGIANKPPTEHKPPLEKIKTDKMPLEPGKTKGPVQSTVPDIKAPVSTGNIPKGSVPLPLKGIPPKVNIPLQPFAPAPFPNKADLSSGGTSNKVRIFDSGPKGKPDIKKMAEDIWKKVSDRAQNALDKVKSALDKKPDVDDVGPKVGKQILEQLDNMKSLADQAVKTEKGSQDIRSDIMRNIKI